MKVEFSDKRQKRNFPKKFGKQRKTTRNPLILGGFLVAEAGLEPTTSGL